LAWLSQGEVAVDLNGQERLLARFASERAAKRLADPARRGGGARSRIAPAPTNLVSMYSSVYWNVGFANQGIFESSQGRFKGGYWDNLDAYLRNSPVIHARNVKTPLLMLHNDKDGAVDFNQGIEYFNTLRRLNKPVVMLQYRGENHGLAKPANQKDYSIRMREFFDHHLKGKPAPRWLKEGVPHLKMEEHLKERANAK
jgi:hypothetical protein